MGTLRFIVSDDDKGMRLDSFLVARTGLTRSKDKACRGWIEESV